MGNSSALAGEYRISCMLPLPMPSIVSSTPQLSRIFFKFDYFSVAISPAYRYSLCMDRHPRQPNQYSRPPAAHFRLAGPTFARGGPPFFWRMTMTTRESYKEMRKIERGLRHLKPCDRFYHIAADWPWPHEYNNRSTRACLWPRRVIRDLMGIGDKP